VTATQREYCRLLSFLFSSSRSSLGFLHTQQSSWTVHTKYSPLRLFSSLWSEKDGPSTASSVTQSATKSVPQILSSTQSLATKIPVTTLPTLHAGKWNKKSSMMMTTKSAPSASVPLSLGQWSASRGQEHTASRSTTATAMRITATVPALSQCPSSSHCSLLELRPLSSVDDPERVWLEHYHLHSIFIFIVQNFINIWYDTLFMQFRFIQIKSQQHRRFFGAHSHQSFFSVHVLIKIFIVSMFHQTSIITKVNTSNTS